MSDATEVGQAVEAEADASPLPWQAIKRYGYWEILSGLGGCVTELPFLGPGDEKDCRADSALIVRAVNNHESLIAALVDEVAVLRTLATDPGLLTAADLLERADRLVALVTKARGGR